MFSVALSVSEENIHMSNKEESWDQYSRLVLRELETLAQGITALREQITDLKSEIAELKAKEDKVQDLVQWKSRIDEISSPTQLKEMQHSVNELKTFKTTAVTVFAVVQTLMAITVAILKFFV